ncbi:uncharacterized protein LOC132543534 isoform X2 [Ylistrum balloti]|uniref:uncharacterized protein LOC132543534 isoform X2 n=1 Tax=Ylistrum balloti TaxID=509963 RepID=UPI002905AA41|nr:uncharacterized protein LOC132543534 isoform X2 [Ylistrum balloti]
MKFRLICWNEKDVHEKAESLSQSLTNRSLQLAFSGILAIQGVQDVSEACAFLGSEFEGTTIFILDTNFVSLMENRKAFKFFQRIRECMSPRHKGHILFINHDVSPEALEEFKKDFELPEYFQQLLVHCAGHGVEEMGNLVYRRLMSFVGPTESEDEHMRLTQGIIGNPMGSALGTNSWERMSVTSLQGDQTFPSLPSHYLRQNSTTDFPFSGVDISDCRIPMEHHCSMSSSESMDGIRQPPVGNSAPGSLSKGLSKSLPVSSSPKPQKDPMQFRSEPAPDRYNGHVTRNNPSHMSGYNPGHVTRNNPSHMSGYNLGHLAEYNSGYIPGQATDRGFPQRVPEQNLEDVFPSDEMFLSSYHHQQEQQQSLGRKMQLTVGSNDSGVGRELFGIQFISHNELGAQDSNRSIASSYILGDMEHLMDNLDENALPLGSLVNSRNDGQTVTSGFCVDCKKIKESSALRNPQSASGNNDFYMDESVAQFSTYGPSALRGICTECVQKKQRRKSDSIPSMGSSTVNAMILSDASGKLENIHREQQQMTFQGQRSRQHQGAFQRQGFNVGQSPSQNEKVDQWKISENGLGLKQGQMSQDQRSLQQGQMLNQRQTSQDQMSVPEPLSQGQLAEQIQMNRIATKMSDIRLSGPQSIALSETNRDINGILQAYRSRNVDPTIACGVGRRNYYQTMATNSPNLGQQGLQAMVTNSPNLGQQGLQGMATNSPNLGRQVLPAMATNSQNLGLQGLQAMASNSPNLGRQGLQAMASNSPNLGRQGLQAMATNSPNMGQQGLPTNVQHQKRQGECRSFETSLEFVGDKQTGHDIKMTNVSCQSMTSPHSARSQQTNTSLPILGMPMEMNLLSNVGGISRGPQSLPSNVQSKTVGYFMPNIRQGDCNDHSSIQSETDNSKRNGDVSKAEYDLARKEDRSNSMKNSTNHRGRDDGASGGTDPEPTNDASGAENQADIYDLTLSVFEFIRDQLDCSQMYNWRNLADLHGLNYRQIQDIEQLWKSHRIESPFVYLIRTFQRYTVQQLRDDLQRIPRCDLLDRLKKWEIEGKLPPYCAGLFTRPS